MTEGNLVSSGPGEATLMTTVVSLDPIHAHFDADERIFLRYSALARSAGKANASTPDWRFRWRWPTKRASRAKGVLDFLDNRLDPASGTIRGRAAFQQPRRRADARACSCGCASPASGTMRALLVQDRAIGTDLDKKFVLVVGPDRPSSTARSRSGPLVDGLRVVRTGLAGGDRVVVNGLQRVRPGAKVDAVHGADGAGGGRRRAGRDREVGARS